MPAPLSLDRCRKGECELVEIAVHDEMGRVTLTLSWKKHSRVGSCLLSGRVTA